MNSLKLQNKSHYAFTLAEVLITLGIIGVVAALTLPTLIQNYKKSVVETRLAKFYSTINQAIKLSEVENGDKSLWARIEGGVDEDGTSKTLVWVNKYLIPYTKITEVRPSENGINVVLYFPDGSAVFISHASWIFFPEAKDLKKYSTKFGGTKSFTFNFYPNIGVEPFQYNATAYHLSNWSVGGCIAETTNSERPCCAALIKKNGWKIPNNYPLKF